MTAAPTTTSADAAARTLLRTGLNNSGWETRTRPDGAIGINRGDDTIAHVHVAPIHGHGSNWWHWGTPDRRGRAITPAGDTDRALERINNTLGPTPKGSR